MSFFISNAYAAGAPSAGGSDQFITIIIFVVLIGFFWLFLIRPQQKKQKEHQKMLSAISKGDEVVTSGGVLGRVKELGDQFLTLEVAKGVELHIQRQAVGAVMPKGTLKNV